MTGLFDAEVYRAHNTDLREMTDFQLREHCSQFANERRIYGNTSSTAEFLSMRWLRGSGMEVGAGSHPTRLFGNAKAIAGDCDKALVFGGKSLDFVCSLDDPEFPVGHLDRFDFVVASHVLEHVDSFLRALENLFSVTRAGGIIYIVLPDIEILGDKYWLPFFDFEHHRREYLEPLAYATLHDQLYIVGSGIGNLDENVHASLSADYKRAVFSGTIPPGQRFLHHKHNYDFDGWLNMFHEAKAFFDGRFKQAEVRYGHERMDCHFVLEVK